MVNHSAFADLVRQLSDGFADQLGKLRQQRRPSHAELAVLFHHRSRGATKLDEPPWQRSHHPTRARTAAADPKIGFGDGVFDTPRGPSCGKRVRGTTVRARTAGSLEIVARAGLNL